MTPAQALYPQAPVLVVDDEEAFLESASFILNRAGITHAILCHDSRKVLAMLQQQVFSILLLDLYMPGVSGLDLLPAIVSDFPYTPVVVITAANEVEIAVSCMKTGAYDYLVKPINSEVLIATVNRALKYWELHRENRQLKKYLLSNNLEHPQAFSRIITRGSKMMPIFQYIEAIASTRFPVFITGETGVGKELIAETLHHLSQRPGKFVPVNVAGVDDNLFTDTLFGHKRGAFTGAEDSRKGLIENAAEGTLFLDEIGDLSFPSQIKLLRLLQEGKYYPLGSDRELRSDARVLVATNKNIQEAVQKGEFRKDLYYRLNAHHIRIPPLRERLEDLPLLLSYFITEAARTMGKKEPTIPQELLILLANYDFPGNIRELKGMLFDALARHRKGVLSLTYFKENIHLKSSPANYQAQVSGIPAGPDWLTSINGQFPTLKEVQEYLVSEALRLAKGNQGIAASLLGMTRKALNKRLNKNKKGDGA